MCPLYNTLKEASLIDGTCTILYSFSTQVQPGDPPIRLLFSKPDTQLFLCHEEMETQFVLPFALNSGSAGG